MQCQRTKERLSKSQLIPLRKEKKKGRDSLFTEHMQISLILGEGSRRLTSCHHHFLVDKKAEA